MAQPGVIFRSMGSGSEISPATVGSKNGAPFLVWHHTHVAQSACTLTALPVFYLALAEL